MENRDDPYSTEQPYVIQCSLQDKTGSLWFGTSGGEGVFRYDAVSGTCTNFSVKDGLMNNDVYSIYEDKTGNLWFGTLDGVSCYDGKGFVSISIPDMKGNGIDPLWRIPQPLPPEYTPTAKSVLSILEDKAGNLWFGTSGAGAFRYANCQPNGDSGKCFTNFLYTNFSAGAMIHPDHLLRNGMSCMLEDKTGNIWFGSFSHGGVYRYDPSTGVVKNFLEKDGLSDAMINTLLEDKNGNIWVGTRNGGACRYDPASDSFTRFSEKEGLCGNWISCIFEDSNGTIWLGSGTGSDTLKGGLCYFDGRNFISPATKDYLIPAITTITQDKAKNLWLGTRNGELWRYDPGTDVITNFSGKVPRR